MLHKSGFSLIYFQLLNLLIMNSNGLGSSKPKKDCCWQRWLMLWHRKQKPSLESRVTIRLQLSFSLSAIVTENTLIGNTFTWTTKARNQLLLPNSNLFFYLIRSSWEIVYSNARASAYVLEWPWSYKWLYYQRNRLLYKQLQLYWEHWICLHFACCNVCWASHQNRQLL